jgi:polysaccharide deacetylase family protein (PEP-CTERM system associated)
MAMNMVLPTEVKDNNLFYPSPDLNYATLENMKNVLTIDVEEWFQVEALSEAIDFERWESFKGRLFPNLLKILALLREKEVKATFFVLGWVAERFPDLVLMIRQEGHEIASHGYAHQLVYQQDEKSFEEDVSKSKEILEDIIGEKVIGYRAPSFSITPDCFWAYNILAKLGIKYDSSIFPVKHLVYGIPSAPRFPFTINLDNGKKIMEFPLSTVRIIRFNFPVAGGGYLRLFPYVYTRWAIKKLNKQGQRAIVYFHPWEIDPHQPKQKVRLSNRIRHYTNLSIMESRIERLLNDFEFSSIKDIWEIK